MNIYHYGDYTFFVVRTRNQYESFIREGTLLAEALPFTTVYLAYISHGLSARWLMTNYGAGLEYEFKASARESLDRLFQKYNIGFE